MKRQSCPTERELADTVSNGEGAAELKKRIEMHAEQCRSCAMRLSKIADADEFLGRVITWEQQRIRDARSGGGWLGLWRQFRIRALRFWRRSEQDQLDLPDKLVQ